MEIVRVSPCKTCPHGNRKGVPNSKYTCFHANPNDAQLEIHGLSCKSKPYPLVKYACFQTKPKDTGLEIRGFPCKSKTYPFVIHASFHTNAKDTKSLEIHVT